jgi:hypothetical protein
MRARTGGRSEIMSAFRMLRSLEGDHGEPGRPLLTQLGHGLCNAVVEAIGARSTRSRLRGMTLATWYVEEHGRCRARRGVQRSRGGIGAHGPPG